MRRLLSRRTQRDAETDAATTFPMSLLALTVRRDHSCSLLPSAMSSRVWRITRPVSSLATTASLLDRSLWDVGGMRKMSWHRERKRAFVLFHGKYPTADYEICDHRAADRKANRRNPIRSFTTISNADRGDTRKIQADLSSIIPNHSCRGRDDHR